MLPFPWCGLICTWGVLSQNLKDTAKVTSLQGFAGQQHCARVGVPLCFCLCLLRFFAQGFLLLLGAPGGPRRGTADDRGEHDREEQNRADAYPELIAANKFSEFVQI